MQITRSSARNRSYESASRRRDSKDLNFARSLETPITLFMTAEREGVAAIRSL